MKTRIVAEIGCNHNGDISLAKELVQKASEAGASAVKFQIFNPSELVSIFAQKAEYQQKNTGAEETQIEMLRKLELSKEDYLDIKKYAESFGLEIFATAFDDSSFRFLCSIGQNIWKIPSGEITNLPFLEQVRDLQCENKVIIMSTGMSTIEEISYASTLLEESPNTKRILLHCNTDYPTNDQDMNILAMKDLANKFPKWEIGLSDHSEGTMASILAVSLGAVLVEKHFTLDKTLPGPDHKASITPDELEQLCRDVSRAEIMLGCEEKSVTLSEKKNIFAARKSIVAKRIIKTGEIFTEENITCKRPGSGISPVYWHNVLGQIAEQDFAPDQLVRCNGIKWENENE